MVFFVTSESGIQDIIYVPPHEVIGLGESQEFFSVSVGFSENDPVEIRSIKLNDDNSVIYAEIYAKNRKKGYLDGMMAIASQLDSPYYF